MKSILDHACNYHTRGMMPLPIPKGSKNPNRQGWQNESYTESELSAVFAKDMNMGLLLGDRSNGLTDIDLDWPEARNLASALLPATEMVSGRTSAPASHYWYICDPAIKTAKFIDPSADDDSRSMIVELRSTGCQTVVPPSVHPNGELYEWHGSLQPAKVKSIELLSRVSKLAACALLARHWQYGQRQYTALALAGTLLRAGWNRAYVENFIRLAARAADDDEIDARVRTVETTEQRIRSGGEATGLPALADLIGEKVVACLRKWLDLPKGPKVFVGGAMAQAKPDDESVPTPVRAWPAPLTANAYHGLAGDIVQAIEPHTEADLAALLVQFLVAFGNIIGRNPYQVVESSRHYLNLFATIVGKTSKGRKGTGWDRIRNLFERVEEGWSEHVTSGLSTGEGLIWAVHDPVEKREPIREKKLITDYQTLVVDEGIADKRLLVLESELASTLRVAGRDGNNLTATVRRAWDDGMLRVMNKNSPAKATAAHISIIGHITADELRRYLDRTEIGNGFANRFLWICSRRSKLLPEGGNLEPAALNPLVERLRSALEFANGVREMRRDDEARALWYQIYETLSDGKPGLFGAVVSRAEAQVMRLACLYALLDCSSLVRRPHLEAALAVWRYAEDSARFIFGDRLGDPVADEILPALRQRPEGMTRTELHELFKRHRSGHELGRALADLSEHGLVRREMEQTEGRSAERWYAVKRVAYYANCAKEADSSDPSFASSASFAANGNENEEAEWTA